MKKHPTSWLKHPIPILLKRYNTAVYKSYIFNTIYIIQYILHGTSEYTVCPPLHPGVFTCFRDPVPSPRFDRRVALHAVPPTCAVHVVGVFGFRCHGEVQVQGLLNATQLLRRPPNQLTGCHGRFGPLPKHGHRTVRLGPSKNHRDLSQTSGSGPYLGGSMSRRGQNFEKSDGI